MRILLLRMCLFVKQSTTYTILPLRQTFHFPFPFTVCENSLRYAVTIFGLILKAPCPDKSRNGIEHQIRPRFSRWISINVGKWLHFQFGFIQAKCRWYFYFLPAQQVFPTSFPNFAHLNLPGSHEEQVNCHSNFSYFKLTEWDHATPLPQGVSE